MHFYVFTPCFLLIIAQYVAAHGYVDGIAIDGTWYAGSAPNNYKGESRRVISQSMFLTEQCRTEPYSPRQRYWSSERI